MRKLIILLLIVASVGLACHKANPYKIRQPESVVWNPITQTYLISNAGSGIILSLKDKYEFFVFNRKPLSSPKGMAILDKTLYVADRTNLIGLDLETGKQVYNLQIPGAIFLNDVAVSPDNTVYVSDTDKNCIFIVHPSTNKVDTYTNKNMSKPNGLYFFYRNGEPALAYVSFREKADFEVIDLKTKALEAMPNTQMSFADGITREPDGSWLVSTWSDSTVWKFSPDFKTRGSLQDKYRTPADIFYNNAAKELAIPCFDGNTVTFVAKADSTAPALKPTNQQQKQ